MFYPVRPGNRGGRDLFKWDDVRYMKYNDREQYLGVTVRAGFLDKGGKWRKGDWYLKEKSNQQNQEINLEKLEFQMQDERRIRQALGLEERQAIDEGPKLTKYEIEEITRKNEMEVDEDNPENALGLGFKLNEKAIMSQKLGNDPKVNYNRLEGEGVLGANENEKKFNGQSSLARNIQDSLKVEANQGKENQKKKKERKVDPKDQMTKEEKQAYIEKLENEIKQLRQRKEQKQQEKEKQQTNEKEKQELKEKEKQEFKQKEEMEKKEKERKYKKTSQHKHRNHSRSRSNSRNTHRHHKR